MVSTQVLIYMGHALSSWGDRVWYFAIPLFLTDLNPESLFLTALYGLVMSTSVFFGVPMVGRWIDKTHRLKAMVVLLTIQNIGWYYFTIVLLFYFIVSFFQYKPFRNLFFVRCCFHYTETHIMKLFNCLFLPGVVVTALLLVAQREMGVEESVYPVYATVIVLGTYRNVVLYLAGFYTENLQYTARPVAFLGAEISLKYY